MGLINDEVIGNLTDEEDSDIPQTVINSESLYIHNKNVLNEYVKKRISIYQLDFLFSNISNKDIMFWFEFFNLICDHYNLECLKLKIKTESDIIVKNIKEFFYILKIVLVKELETDKNIESFLNNIFRSKNELVQLILLEQVTNIKKFYETIVKESETPYEEI